MSEAVATGGCLCGAVRMRAVGEPICVVYCHCDDCRRASGAPLMVFAGYDEERARIEGEPSFYSSSPGVRRSFCGKCGTSISYKDELLPGEVYLCVGVFDDPGRFEPEAHGWVSRRLPWLRVRDGLPVYEKSTRPR